MKLYIDQIQSHSYLDVSDEAGRSAAGTTCSYEAALSLIETSSI